MGNVYSDLIAILICYGVFILAYASNVVFSLYQNMKIFNEPFDKKKLIQGILKCFIFVLGTLLLVLAIDFAVYVFNKYGIISDQIGDMVTIVMMLGTIGTAAAKYIKEAYQTFVSVLTTEK